MSQANSLSVPHLLGIKDLTKDDITLILDTAATFKEVINRPIKKVPSLRDVTVVNLFFENSTRTRISFELAERRLSADVLNFTASSSSVSKGETLLDTVNNILAMKVDMVVMRHPAPGAMCFYPTTSMPTSSMPATVPTSIPPRPARCLFHDRSHWPLEGKNILIVGDILHSRVALSNILCLKKLGANVAVCGPPTLFPNTWTAWA
jgi:aspartate carbamoyltransferase catalytic subunit